jgi:hypothetical protein
MIFVHILVQKISLAASKCSTAIYGSISSSSSADLIIAISRPTSSNDGQVTKQVFEQEKILPHGLSTCYGESQGLNVDDIIGIF